MHNPESLLENKMHGFLWDFEKQTDLLISARQPDFVVIKKKCQIVDFAVPADHRVKLKESKKDKYLNLARKLKNCGTWKWRWYQMFLCSWYSHQERRAQVETIWTTPLLTSDKILRSVLETCGDLLSPKL